MMGIICGIIASKFSWMVLRMTGELPTGLYAIHEIFCQLFLIYLFAFSFSIPPSMFLAIQQYFVCIFIVAAARYGVYAYVNPEVNWDKDENGEYTGILREGGFYALYMVEPVLTDNSRTRIADAECLL